MSARAATMTICCRRLCPMVSVPMSVGGVAVLDIGVLMILNTSVGVEKGSYIVGSYGTHGALLTISMKICSKMPSTMITPTPIITAPLMVVIIAMR